jgi:hypothetical protein
MDKKVTLFKAKRRHMFFLGFTAFLVVLGAYILLVLWPQLQWTWDVRDPYLNVMKKSNSPEYKAEIRSWFDRTYNFTELYEWVDKELEFIPVGVSFERHTDPIEIAQSGKGRCGEFSILYVAACLAHGYESRIVVAVDFSNPLALQYPHVWAEVKLDRWIQVDPSPRPFWNQSQRYLTWPWGSGIGQNVKIYAFEDGNFQEVTSNYAPAD